MSTAKITPHPNENIARLCWVAFVLMFFVLQACLWTYAISATSRDMSHAVVPGYDEQALTWDQVKQSRLESEALGWSASLMVDTAADIRGHRNVTIQLADRDAQPIEKAILVVTAFHRAAAADPQTLTFEEKATGVYAATIDVDRFGKWCLSGNATLGEKVWILDQTIVISEPTNLTSAKIER